MRSQKLANFDRQSGFNGLLDVARQTYKEAVEDADEYVRQLGGKDVRCAL